MQILNDVMAATECAAAVICRELDGKLTIVAGTDSGPLGTIGTLTLTAEAAIFIAALAAQFDSASTSNIVLDGQLGPDVRFAVAVRIEGDEDAFLLVLHNEPRGPLSAAQTYVLRAQSAHLTARFAMLRLQKQLDLVDGSAHQARMERLRLLESVAIHARDSILITEAEPIDLPGPRIIYSNAAFTQTTGYSADEVIGQTPRILQGPKTDPAVRAKLRAAFVAWKPIEIELLNYRKDGTEFWVELSIVPVADERGWYTHWVSVQRDVTERKQAEELASRILTAEFENKALAKEIQQRKGVEAELLYTAFHDNLTRLRNRPFFLERLKAAIEQNTDDVFSPCTVLFLDLDQFKIVNDSLGHAAGDALLIEVAKRLKACVRPQDTLARLGGDEFAILIDDATDLGTSVRIAERIIETLRHPVQLGRQSVFPSCSIGIAQSSPRTITPDELIQQADIAMYVSKRGGFGDYSIFDPSMHDSAVARLALNTDLREAVNNAEFRLEYQPIVDPANRLISGFEALLRWEHSERGTVEPSQFIPVAEELGLIRQIGRWVMHQACAQLSHWQKEFANPDLRMSINTSAAELVDPNFIADLTGALIEWGLQPKCLELEITEGIFLNPSLTAEATITAVRELGVRIALDDFGTGYSSLSYINRYAIDTIKIDKSFIDGVCTDQRTQAIVELIVKLGRTLNVRVVAEGVETQEQVEALVSIGCSAVQGYYFARPLTALAATNTLKSAASKTLSSNV